MRQLLFGIILALLLGLGLGLAYSWLISPVHIIDSEPVALRADFKDQYRSAIAASYAATGNLPRTRARLSLIGDTNPMDALNAQAQRMLASGEFTQADQLVALASALANGNTDQAISSTSTAENPSPTDNAPTATLPPTPLGIPIQFTETAQATETQSVETQVIVGTSTPRPTRTLIPTIGAPFTITGQDTICDTNLPDDLLQVMVFNSKHKQIAGAKINITWDSGEEQFFTGLKPELGNGYADYLMSPNTSYTVQLALGSNIASGLTAPTCQTPSGETFLGGIKLTFQQP